jgi:hypothetical protein
MGGGTKRECDRALPAAGARLGEDAARQPAQAAHHLMPRDPDAQERYHSGAQGRLHIGMVDSHICAEDISCAPETVSGRPHPVRRLVTENTATKIAASRSRLAAGRNVILLQAAPLYMDHPYRKRAACKKNMSLWPAASHARQTRGRSGRDC